MHVLLQNNGQYSIVLHHPVPVGNNSAGFPWRTVIRTSGLGGKTILPSGDGTAGTISAAEKTNIETDGSIYEETVSWDVTRGGQLAGAQILTFMDQLYANRTAQILGLLQQQLDQYGRVR